MRKSFIVGTVLVLVALLFAVPAFAQPSGVTGKKTPTPPGVTIKTICLDPGHGGSDPGAVIGNLYEKDINLDIAFRLKALLVADGFNVVMTRDDDTYLSNNDRYTFANKAGATILISIHTNSATTSSADGTCTLYMKNTDQILAQALQNAVYPALLENAPDPNVFLDRGLIRFASGVLLKAQMPAAMAEPVFMSNPGEATLLAVPIYTNNGVTLNPSCDGCRRAQIAQALHDGIMNYFASGGK